MPAQRAHTKGKPKIRRAQEGSICQAGGVIYHQKSKAVQASAKNQAKRCGRCKQWHAE